MSPGTQTKAAGHLKPSSTSVRWLNNLENSEYRVHKISVVESGIRARKESLSFRQGVKYKLAFFRSTKAKNNLQDEPHRTRGSCDSSRQHRVRSKKPKII